MDKPMNIERIIEQESANDGQSVFLFYDVDEGLLQGIRLVGLLCGYDSQWGVVLF